MKEKLKSVLTDSLWSIAGLVIMNMVLQFVVYKFWNSVLGNEINGTVLAAIAYMNIFAISAGTACNYLRMRYAQTGDPGNNGYLLILAAACLAGVPWAWGSLLLSGAPKDPATVILFVLLCLFTIVRYYADVEFKLTLHYRAFFVYYIIIALGYLLGSFLFRLTGLWPLALLPGDMAGVVMVLCRGRVLRRERPAEAEAQTDRKLFMAYLTLFGTFLLNNALFNGDRILLNALLDGTNVTLYYQASSVGKLMALLSTPLNGVMIGYLARIDGKLNRKIMKLTTLAALGLTAVATLGTTVGSHIYVKLLYPNNYLLERPWFLVASLSQVLFFVASSITVVLLRFSPMSYQVYVNLGYGAVYLILCIPLTMRFGFAGFAWGLLSANAVYLLYSLYLGWRDAGKEKET